MANKKKEEAKKNNNANSDLYDIICIGGGPAAYSAAIYAARFNMKTSVIAKEKGGLLITTHLVENYPGFPSVTGLGLMQEIEKHVKYFNVQIHENEVTNLEKKGNIFIVTAREETYKTKTVLIGTGSKHRQLEVPGNKELYGKGVSYCATCDAPFFKKKTVAMVGGADSAVKEATLLAEFAAKVYVIYRGKEVHPEPITLKRALAMPNIEFINETNVVSIHGNNRVEYIMLDKPYKGSNKLELQGVFVAIGQVPVTELAKQAGAKLNERGEVIIDRYARTSVPGLYAAGDCGDTQFKQAIISAAEGVYGAWQAFEYVQHHDNNFFKE
ncbi:FAD-dependent oxidoreductase [Candidatus Woesearchaeota archaeon]|nr:FAD-dependent oxidoreductase [Candidatus Woesearchaeota archaeon]